MKVIVATNNQTASRHVATMITNQLSRKPNSAFLLPTGSTPLKLYQLLQEKVGSGKTSFSLIKTFNLDEYLGLSPENPQSYHRFMWDNFFSHIDIKRSNVKIPSGNPKNAASYCKKYEQTIDKAKVDLAILGLGTNGHIGFNEPGTDPDSITHIADLTPSTIKANARFFKSKKEVPTQAITVGLKTILKSKKIIVMAFGKSKAQAVHDTLEKTPSPKTPASVLQKHKNITFVLDQAAASKLTKTSFYPPVLSGIRLYSKLNLPTNKKIVFFSPHPDDAAISAGALLNSLSANNEVYELIVTTGHRAVINGGTTQNRIKIREKEVQKESFLLGTKCITLRCHFYDNNQNLPEKDLKKIRSLMKKIKPNIAFVPHKLDPHPTHATTRTMALAALPHHTSLWSFETPWSLFSHKKFNAAFEFSDKLMKTKLRSIRCHKSQLARTSFDQAALSIASFRRITLAEQLFSELGKQSLETKPYLELFNISEW